MQLFLYDNNFIAFIRLFTPVHKLLCFQSVRACLQQEEFLSSCPVADPYRGWGLLQKHLGNKRSRMSLFSFLLEKRGVCCFIRSCSLWEELGYFARWVDALIEGEKGNVFIR